MASLSRPTARLAAAALSAAVVAGTAVAVAPSTSAYAASYTQPSLSRFDSRLVAKINHVRANHGLRRLVVTAGTTDVAHGWSCHMAGDDLLAHNGHLASALETHGSADWTTYAENVGMQVAGQSARRLFKAYMHSPEHRANILDPSARFLGVWSKKGSGLRFNTLDFVGATSSAYDDSYGAARRTC